MLRWQDKEITEPQYEAITRIQQHTRHVFRGATRGDASEFIGAYKEESIEAEQADRNILEADRIYDEMISDIYMWGNE